jgi:hypothetical protein
MRWRRETFLAPAENQTPVIPEHAKDARPCRSYAVTCIELQEKIDECIRDNRNISSFEAVSYHSWKEALKSRDIKKKNTALLSNV